MILLLAFLIALATRDLWVPEAHAAGPSVVQTQATVAASPAPPSTAHRAAAAAAPVPTAGDGWSLTGPNGETRSDSVWVTKPPHDCLYWAAGWVQYPGPCGWHRLPGWFRRGVGSTVTGCLIGLASGGDVMIGCLGGFLGSIQWG